MPATDVDGKTRESGPFYNAQNAVRQIAGETFEDICLQGSIELTSLGVDSENSDSEDPITDPFDPSKIKVDREPMPIFQVLRKITLGQMVLNPEFQPKPGLGPGAAISSNRVRSARDSAAGFLL